METINRPKDTIWDVLLAPAYPGTVELDWGVGDTVSLSPGIWVGRADLILDYALVMDACEPGGYARSNVDDGNRWQPTRHFGIYYAIVNETPLDPSGYDWDSNQALQHVMAVSRLVHPTALGLEYAARVKYARDGETESVFPAPWHRAYAVSAAPSDRQRHWLEKSEWGKVARLISRCPILAKLKRPRIGRALYYFETAARQYHFPDRFELLVRTCEILWGRTFAPDPTAPKGKKPKVGRGARFQNGLTQLAKELNLTITETQIKHAWHYRSGVTHGVGLPAPADPESPNQHETDLNTSMIDAYVAVESVLRKTIEAAILDNAFASRFDDDAAIVKWLGE